jgi:hypothetical protein
MLTLLLAAAAGFGLRLYMNHAGENRLRPGEDIAIGELRGPLPPNAFLACPPGYCRIAAEAAPSPEFAIGADRLYREFAAFAAREPRVTTIVDETQQPHGSSPWPAGQARGLKVHEGPRLVLVQRSQVFRFPDIVSAEFVALGPARSSLALYSRARYGRYDFGVNRRRVEGWEARLAEIIAPQ